MYWKLTLAGLRAYLRDRAGLMWSFAFPLIFVLLFGTMLGRSDGGNAPKFTVGLVLPQATPQTSWVPTVFQAVPIFDIQQGNYATESHALETGKRSAIIVFPSDFAARMAQRRTAQVRVLYDPAQPQTAQMVTGLISQVISQIDKKMSGDPTLIQASTEPFSIGPAAAEGANPHGLDFMLPGVLAMTIMQLGIFTAIPLINMREKGILKRLRATPVPRLTFVGSQVTLRLIIGVLQTITVVGVGTALFQFHAACSWVALLAMVIFAVLTFVSIGAILASVAKTQESGVAMVQLVNLPMVLLSGLFLPADLLPHSIKPFMTILPATYLGDALRHIMLAVPSAYSFTTDLTVLGAWLVGGLVIAARLFRWE